jgi:hypothetical protein
MNIDTSRVDRMEIRGRLAAQDEQRAAICKEIDAAEAPFDERIAVIEKERDEATRELYARLAAHDEATRSDDKHCYGFDDDGQRERCCVSGLVLLEGDETIGDDDGREALKALLPWPAAEPEPEDEIEEDEEEAEAEAEPAS